MKKIFLLIFLTAVSARLFALNTPEINDSVLQNLLQAQQQNSRAYASNEAFLETGALQYDISKSGLYPQINLDLSGTGSNAFYQRYKYEPDALPDTTFDIELNNSYLFSAGPEINITQLLPSAGVLSGSITDSVSAAGLEESSHPDFYKTSDTKYSNDLTFSLGVSQPVYFGNAYKAGLVQINESREINRITYLDNRNSLIISAVADYYELIQKAYQLDLVQTRLEVNSENEKKMLREHELGMWTRAQLNSAAAVRLQSEADLLKSKMALTSIMDRIAALYGIELDMESTTRQIEQISFSLSDVNPDDADILSSSPAILIYQKRIMIADSAVTIQKKDSAITLSAGGSYTISNGITDESSASDNLVFSLGLSVPVADGKASGKSIELKQKESEKLQNDYDDQQKRTRAELQTLLNNISVSKRLSEIYRLQEEAAAFDLEKGVRELELGGISQKELLDLQINLENTRLTMLVNKIEYNLTVLNIYKLLGIDLQMLTMNPLGEK